MKLAEVRRDRPPCPYQPAVPIRVLNASVVAFNFPTHPRHQEFGDEWDHLPIGDKVYLCAGTQGLKS
jgi:hypothetical protein